MKNGTVFWMRLICVALAWVSVQVHAQAYTSYQRFTTKLEETLDAQEKRALEDFIARYQKGAKEERIMAHDLGLRWALKQRAYAQALPHIDALVQLSSATQKHALEKLGVEVAYAAKEYALVQKYARTWMAQGLKEGKEYAHVATIRAYAYRETKQREKAIAWMQKAWKAEKEKARGDFLLMSWQEKEDFASQRKLLPRMVTLYKNPVYWSHWAAVRMHFGARAKAYQILSSAYKAQHLEKSMYVFYVYLMLQEGVPQKAVRFLEQHAKDFPARLYRILYWRALLAAKEEKKALAWQVSVRRNGVARQKLWLAYRQKAWSDVSKWSQRVIAKKEKRGKSVQAYYYLLMQAYYRQKKWDAAKDALSHLTEPRWARIRRAYEQQIQFLQE